MKKRFTILFSLSILSSWIFIFSCKKDKPTEPPIDFGYNYFPDAKGTYVIYEVDSTWQDDISGIDTTYKYLLKEIIADILPDNSGRPTMRIERFFKKYDQNIPYDSIPWSGPRVWTANKTITTVERKEENITYLKLVFPAHEGKKWNGNMYNTFPSKEYEITSADKKETVNSISFDSVATVKQFENINIIEYRYEEEKYARNIGLIYKKRDSIYWGGGADTVGYLFTQKIVGYGK